VAQKRATTYRAFVGAQFESPGFTVTQDAVTRYCQEDETLGKDVIGFVAEGARQGSGLLRSFADADGEVLVIAEIGSNDATQIAELVCEMNI
jgi:hypothetical protein